MIRVVSVIWMLLLMSGCYDLSDESNSGLDDTGEEKDQSLIIESIE